MPEQPRNIAIAWYRPNQWDLLLARSEDAEDLENSYDEWLANAQDTLLQLRLAGLNAVRVDVDVEAMALWCETLGIPLDGSARARYAAHALRRRENNSD